jgi:hypothetical protein
MYCTAARAHLRRVIKHQTSFPVYQTGKYAGVPWTQRNAGELLASIRVVEQKEKFGREFFKIGSGIGGVHGDVRVYAGHYMAWYADIVEYYTPFLRPAVEGTRSQVKSILENG